MKDNLTGPALGGVEARWSAFPKSDLHSWIRNSQGLIAKGHPRAVELYNANNKLVMTAFPAISDEEIESILLYIDCTAKGTCGPKDAASALVLLMPMHLMVLVLIFGCIWYLQFLQF